MLAGASQWWILKSSIKGSQPCTEIHSAEHTRVFSTRLKVGNGRNQISSLCKPQLKLNGVLIDRPHRCFACVHPSPRITLCGWASTSSLHTVQQDSTVETHPFYYIREPWEFWDFFLSFTLCTSLVQSCVTLCMHRVYVCFCVVWVKGYIYARLKVSVFQSV